MTEKADYSSNFEVVALIGGGGEGGCTIRRVELPGNLSIVLISLNPVLSTIFAITYLYNRSIVHAILFIVKVAESRSYRLENL